MKQNNMATRARDRAVKKIEDQILDLTATATVNLEGIRIIRGKIDAKKEAIATIEETCLEECNALNGETKTDEEKTEST